MRKLLVVLTIGVTALAAAACGPEGTPLESGAPLETLAPLGSDALESMDPFASPSDMLESPASS